MDYYASAAEASVDSHLCEICDHELESHDPVYIDIDLGGNGQPVAIARHRWCHEEVQMARVHAYELAARLVERYGSQAIEELRRRAKHTKAALAPPQLGTDVPANETQIRG